MKTLVTGGCGFIGSHLIEALIREGHEVIILDNLATGKKENIKSITASDRISIHEVDISEPGSWSELFANVSNVVHLAALIDIVASLKDPSSYFKTNVVGTFNVLEACRSHEIKRFVYVNSGACYGVADEYPTKEDAQLKPQYPYALTKVMGEQMTMHWAAVYGIPALSLRIFNLYGPRCSALFGLFMAQKAAGKPLTLTGDGSQTRDFTYITDVTAAIIAAINSDKSAEIYNIGSGTTVPVKQVAELLQCPVEYVPRRPGEMNVTFGDISKALRDLDWEPKISIEKGVELMLQTSAY